MSDPKSQSSGELWTIRVPVVFEVCAHSRADAHRMVDDALTGPGRATAPFQDQGIVHPNGDVEGVLGWSHQEDTVPGLELPRWRQRSFLADLTTVQILRAMIDAGLGKPAQESRLTAPELAQVQMTVAAADRFVTIPNPDDADSVALFEGHASEAIDALVDGVYDGKDVGGQDLRIVVGRSRFVGGGRAAASLPAGTADSRTVDEIARLLGSYIRTSAPASMLTEVSRLVEAAGRDGLKAAELRGAGPGATPSPLVSVGVITWSDDPDTEPTIMVGPRILELTRNVATMVHLELVDSDAFDGAAEFIRSHTDAADWGDARDVDEWLEALQDAMPYPRVTLTQLPLSGGGDGYNYLLAQALTRRAAQMDPDGTRALEPGTDGLGRAL